VHHPVWLRGQPEEQLETRETASQHNGAGKTFLFAIPLLMDTTNQKMVLVISPLNALEYDQVNSMFGFL
jgi:superfamily II DNA helicase RecQ